jgi:hypothetical protein
MTPSQKYIYLIISISLIAHFGFAQRVLQIEKFGSPKTKKLFPGEEIVYQIRDTEGWSRGVIDQLVVDQNLIGLQNRYVKLDDITAFRYHRDWPKPFAKQLFWFGAAWSFYGFIGPLTDDVPDNGYRKADAIVTGSSWVIALALPKILNYRIVRFGKRKRLRMLDLNFSSIPYDLR